MIIKKCRCCQIDFIPSRYQLRRDSFLCLPCRRIYDHNWRLRRKLEGRPVISTKLPKEYHREYAVRYNQRPDIKKRNAERMKRYRLVPELAIKHKARWHVQKALLRKIIIKQPCEICGEVKSQAHHSDYTKPLDVRWLCRPCHVAIHARAEGKGDQA